MRTRCNSAFHTVQPPIGARGVVCHGVHNSLVAIPRVEPAIVDEFAHEHVILLIIAKEGGPLTV